MHKVLQKMSVCVCTHKQGPGKTGVCVCVRRVPGKKYVCTGYQRRCVFVCVCVCVHRVLGKMSVCAVLGEGVCAYRVSEMMYVCTQGPGKKCEVYVWKTP